MTTNRLLIAATLTMVLALAAVLTTSASAQTGPRLHYNTEPFLNAALAKADTFAGPLHFIGESNFVPPARLAQAGHPGWRSVRVTRDLSCYALGLAEACVEPIPEQQPRAAQRSAPPPAMCGSCCGR